MAPNAKIFRETISNLSVSVQDLFELWEYDKVEIDYSY